MSSAKICDKTVATVGNFVFMCFLSIFVNSNNLNNQYLECYEKKNLPYELHRGYFHDHPVLGVC